MCVAGAEKVERSELMREGNPDVIYHVFSAVHAQHGPLEEEIVKLDGARSQTAITRQLDRLARRANDAAREGQAEVVMAVLHGIMIRESALIDPTLRRIYQVVIRRVAHRTALGCVVAQLPRDRERYGEYMTVIRRAEDVGTEALVDALGEATSIAERRVYYDALVRLNAGVRTLIFMLGDERWYVARNVADVLGEMRVTEADAALTRLLEHDDERVRAAAANALAKFGTASAVKALRVALRDASPEVRERAAEALGQAKTRQSAAQIIHALQSETDARAQLAMIAALGQLRSSAAVQKLIELARSDARTPFARKRVTRLRVAAVHALGESRTRPAQAALQALTQDRVKEVRGAASWELLAAKDTANPEGVTAKPPLSGGNRKTLPLEVRQSVTA